MKALSYLIKQALSMVQFIKLELYKMNLQDEAQVLGISKTTCFYIHHKLYHAVSEIMSHQK